MSQKPMTGYRKRPLELTLLAVAFALVPLFSWMAWYAPFLLAGRPESPWDVLIANFGTAVHGPWGLAHSLLMGLLWLMFWVVGWGIWRVTQWGFVLCIVAAVANSLFSMVLYGVSQGADGVTERIIVDPFQLGVLINLVFFVPVILILQRDIMAPFFNPKLKWWEQHPRVKASLSIEATIGGVPHNYKSFDISASGMFLGTGDLASRPIGDGQYENFPAKITLEESGTVVEVICTVVWISSGSGQIPAGCGVTFEYKDRSQRRALVAYLKKKIADGHVIERT